jgi:hypothetical protein
MVDLMRHMELLGPSDYTLSVSERAGLEVSMMQRQHEESLEGKMLFWGKVLADDADYMICYALCTPTIEEGEFPVRRYYYATASDTTLRRLPVLSKEYKELAAAVPPTQRFQGDPSLPLDAEPEDMPEQDEETVSFSSHPPDCFDRVLHLQSLDSLLFARTCLLVQNHCRHHLKGSVSCTDWPTPLLR